MKKSVSFFLFLFITTFVSAQNWQWMKNYGNSNYAVGETVRADNNGNVYSTVSFTGATSVGTNFFSALSGQDFLITKHNSSGVLQWVIQIPGTGNEGLFDMVLDGAGNIYLDGIFNATINFPAGALTTSGLGDTFFAKFDANGNNIWAKRIGGPGNDASGPLAYSSIDNTIVLAGGYSGTESFGTTNFTSNGGYDSYFAKCDTAGNFIWARGMGGTLDEMPTDIAIDAASNIVAAGSNNSSTSTFYGSNTATINAPQGSDFYVVRYDGAGNLLWAKDGGGTGAQYTRRIGTDPAGNIFIGGNYANNGWSMGTVVFPIPGGSQNSFVLKLNSSGIAQWGTPFELSANTVITRGLEIDAAGNPIVLGTFNTELYVDSVLLMPVDMANDFNSNYIIKLGNNAGNIMWYRKIGGSDICDQMALDYLNGNIYTTGYLKGTGSVGTTNFNVGVSARSYDVIKLQDCTPPISNIHATGPTTFCDGDSVYLTTFNTCPGCTYQWQLNGMDEPGETNTGTYATWTGDYELIITNPTGCSGPSAVLPVYVNVLPVVSVSTTPYIFNCHTDSVELDLVPQLNTTRQWYFNNNPITNATALTYMATVAGTYKVIVTGPFGCTKASVPIVVTLGGSFNIAVTGTNVICNNTTASIHATGGSTYNWSPSSTLNTSTGANVVASPTVTTTYTVIGHNGNNTCSDTQTFTVNVFLPPIITYNNFYLICTNHTTSLEWYFNTVLIPFETNDSLVPTQNGQYYVTLNDTSFNCTLYSNVIDIFNAGIVGSDKELHFVVQPNPFSEIATIRLSEAIDHGKVFIKDVLGKTVREAEIKNASEIIIEKKNLTPGIYFVFIDSEKGRAAAKVVVE